MNNFQTLKNKAPRLITGITVLTPVDKSPVGTGEPPLELCISRAMKPAIGWLRSLLLNSEADYKASTLFASRRRKGKPRNKRPHYSDLEASLRKQKKREDESKDWRYDPSKTKKH
ncbi:hypothetical protein ScPMuIL_013523 [Solemya velum]